MEDKTWIRLDNASNIFVAARNSTDTKVFRLSAEIKKNVNPEILQEALNITYKLYPLFHNVLRRGIFWYYLEQSEIDPIIEKEVNPPCSPIYHYDKKELLFRVLYRENQIHLEVFHALTDGTGALWFFEDLLNNYIHLVNTGRVPKIKREKVDFEDSFNRYFYRTNKDIKKTKNKKTKKSLKKSLRKIFEPTYQVKGKKTPDNRLRIVNMSMPVNQVLTLARKESVSLTIYLTALYILSVYETANPKKKKTKISVSIPINLRSFFPSISTRNFFSTTIVSYTFDKENKTNLRDICKEINIDFKEQLQKEALEDRLRRFIKFEYNPLTRVVLRPVKDLLLKIINWLNNHYVTVAMSNLGVIQIPEEINNDINNFYFYTSVIRPQFCMISYKNTLNISFTSPFIENDIYHKFAENLSKRGVDIVVDVNKVTEKELMLK